MKYSFIGCGNIGSAVARGLISKGIFAAADVTCCDIIESSLEQMRKHCPGIKTTTDSREAVTGADCIVVAVKPWAVEQTLGAFKDMLDLDRQNLIVIAAGITFGMMSEWLGADATMFRVIPNTAIAVGSSMTFVSAQNASPERTAAVVEMFDALGSAMLIPEDKMSAGTALASCGIAYAMRYVRAATEGGVELGFPAKDARNIVLNTVKGAVDLLLATGANPEEEIDKVTTPGGITIKGLTKMEEEGFTNAVIAGLKASQSK